MTGTIDTPEVEGVFRLSYGGRNVYLLHRAGSVVLVGAGGPGHLPLISQALSMQGLAMSSIHAILLTHADPALSANAPIIREKSGARIHATELEAGRLSSGKFRRKGIGIGEFIEGRRAALLHFKTFAVDFFVSEGDVLDQWYGLTVMMLPGPTIGHCGYYCRHLGVLFCGALFEKQGLVSKVLRPPFNPELRQKSIAKADALHPRIILQS
ncbi:MAG TPA: MBL fold metallo-hydrolase [Opitutales bacterium]|nr:MBL fold metallo-hydrolase [Opitutales bacterium]